MDAAAVAATPRPILDRARPTVVVVFASDLTEITDALGPYEIFARTKQFNVVTAAAERQPTLLTGGLRMLPHYSLSEITEALGGPPAIVVVPNLPNAGSDLNRSTIDWLRQQATGGALMHSWCKGAMALAETGLLDGQTATAHWGDIPTLEKRYPALHWIRGVRWLEHGHYVMSAGITSGIDASLRVIIRTVGDSVARRVARELRYPNFKYAIDPRVEQYELQAADLVLVANAAYRIRRPVIGVGVYDGVGEIDLSTVYDAHGHTMAAQVESVAENDQGVVSAHGLTLYPSVAASEEPRRVRALTRLIVPDIEARQRAGGLGASITAAAPSLRLDYIHADDAARFGLEPVLEDLARTADVLTARFAQRRLEYRSSALRLEGPSIPWIVVGSAACLGAVGLLIAAGVDRLVGRPRLVRIRFARLSISR